MPEEERKKMDADQEKQLRDLENEVKHKKEELKKHQTANSGIRGGVKKYGQKASRYVGSMTTADVAEKGAAALGNILTAASKFESSANMTGVQQAMTITSGVLDVVGAVSAFLPPPASVITGAVTRYGQ